ncbi:transposable element Tc3 transposase [Trichonephila clavipes]|nr:transposable element Tc3 transposase [Trichonephila clavipes]
MQKFCSPITPVDKNSRNHEYSNGERGVFLPTICVPVYKKPAILGAVVPTRRRNTARATIDLLKDTFGDRLISRFGPVNWPPRSCDLTPLDYFLWGYVKSLVYADKPQTLDHLEYNISRVIADIRPQMLEKVIENGTSRLDYIRASRGSHMPEIIFKM